MHKDNVIPNYDEMFCSCHDFEIIAAFGNLLITFGMGLIFVTNVLYFLAKLIKDLMFVKR